MKKILSICILLLTFSATFSQSTFEERQQTYLDLLLTAPLGWQGYLVKFLDDPTDAANRANIVSCAQQQDEQAAPIAYWAIGLNRNAFTSTELNSMLSAISGWTEVTGYGTENHGLMKKTAGYLFAQFFPTHNSWASYSPPGPLTNAELKYATKSVLIEICSTYYDKGYQEVLSTTYDALHIHPLIALYTLADDQELVDAADAALTYIYTLRALANFDGMTMPPYQRSNYQQTNKIPAGLTTGVNCSSFDWLMWPDAMTKQPGSNWINYSNMQGIYPVAGNWEVPEVLREIAAQRNGTVTKSSHCDFGTIPYDPSRSHSIMRNTYRTENYAIGTGFGQYANDEGYNKLKRFGIFYKTEDTRNHIICKHTYWAADYSEYDRWMQTNGSLFQQDAHDSATVISLFNIPATDPWNNNLAPSSTYSSRDEHYNNISQKSEILYPATIDELVQSSGWIFLREGVTYIAIKSLAGYDEVGTTMSEYKLIKKSASKNAIIFDLGDSDEYGTFTNFQNVIKSNSLTYDLSTPSVTYTKHNGTVIQAAWHDPDYANNKNAGQRAISQADVWRNGVKDTRFTGTNWPTINNTYATLENRILNISIDTLEYQVDWSGTDPVFSYSSDIDPCAGIENWTANYAVTHDVPYPGQDIGAIDVTWSGFVGTPPYTYEWKKTNDQYYTATTEDLTGLDGGTYYWPTITDANDCESPMTSVLVSDDPLNINISGVVTDATAGNSDGAINITVSGGYPAGYEYSWSNGAETEDVTGLSGGEYVIQVLDGYTSNSDTFTVGSGCPVITPTVEYGNDTANTGIGYACITWNNAVTPIVGGWAGSETPVDECLTGLTAGVYYNYFTNDDNGCPSDPPLQAVQIINIIPDSITIYGNVTNTSSGSDGAIAITHTGGFPPYSYSWSDGDTVKNKSGLSEGTYTLTVTGKFGTSAVDSFVVSNTCLDIYPEYVYGNDTANTNRGFIDVSWINASQPYTVLWGGDTTATTEDLSGLGAGTYTSKIVGTDANGCEATDSMEVTITNVVPTPIYVSGQTYPEYMGDSSGSIYITPSGGVQPYSYSWSNGMSEPIIDGLTAGSYTVTVTGKFGTIGSETFTVEDSFNPCDTVDYSNTFYIVTDVTEFYNGGIDMYWSGGAKPLSYIWLDGDVTTEDRDGLITGTYQTRAVDTNECWSDVFTINVTRYVGFCDTVDIDANFVVTETLVEGGTVDLTPNPTGGEPPYTYIWSTGATTKDITVSVAGQYNLRITDDNGCYTLPVFYVYDFKPYRVKEYKRDDSKRYIIQLVDGNYSLIKINDGGN